MYVCYSKQPFYRYKALDQQIHSNKKLLWIWMNKFWNFSLLSKECWFSGKWGVDRCMPRSLIHLPSPSFSPSSVFLAHVSFLCQCFPSSWWHRGEMWWALRKTLFVSRMFFYPCVVPSIPVSFSVHYTLHPPLLALVTPSVSICLSRHYLLPSLLQTFTPLVSLPLSWYEDVDSRNWFQLAALHYWL